METQAAILLAKDSADILLAPQGNIVQNLLVEESVLATSASVKDSVRTLLVDGPRQFRETVPFGSILPPLPFETAVEPFVRKTREEVQAQQLAEKLVQLIAAQQQRSDGSAFGPSSSPNSSSLDATNAVLEGLGRLEPEQAALALKELRENAPKYGPLVGQLAEKMVDKLVETARRNVESAMRS